MISGIFLSPLVKKVFVKFGCRCRADNTLSVNSRIDQGDKETITLKRYTWLILPAAAVIGYVVVSVHVHQHLMNEVYALNNSYCINISPIFTERTP
jgi:hypothetical protein